MTEEYQRLDPRVQKWVFNQGWSDLREIQKKQLRQFYLPIEMF